MNRSLLCHALLALTVLGCARGVGADEDPEFNPTLSPDQLSQSGRAQPALSLGTPALGPVRAASRTDRDAPLAMVASAGGLVLLDASNSHVLATATTTFPVTDIVYDPWRQRWIVVEYDDASANQVSVWRTELQAAQSGVLIRQEVLETGGYCRVQSTRHGMVILEDDGLRGRWLISGQSLSSVRWRSSEPIPSTLVVREMQGASQLIGLVLRDEFDGPTLSLSKHEVSSFGLQSWPEAKLAAWTNQLSPARMTLDKSGRMVVAQARAAGLQVAVINDSGQAQGSALEIAQPPHAVVEDIALDRSTNTALILLSGTHQLMSVQLVEPFAATALSVPGKVSPGSWWAPSRMLAFEPRSRTVLLGMNNGVIGLRAATHAGGQPEPIADWHGGEWRWPVAVATELQED